jgi:hypothetical protein
MNRRQSGILDDGCDHLQCDRLASTVPWPGFADASSCGQPPGQSRRMLRGAVRALLHTIPDSVTHVRSLLVHRQENELG